jgi:hypothetical protein
MIHHSKSYIQHKDILYETQPIDIQQNSVSVHYFSFILMLVVIPHNVFLLNVILQSAILQNVTVKWHSAREFVNYYSFILMLAVIPLNVFFCWMAFRKIVSQYTIFHLYFCWLSFHCMFFVECHSTVSFFKMSLCRMTFRKIVSCTVYFIYSDFIPLSVFRQSAFLLNVIIPFAIYQ